MREGGEAVRFFTLLEGEFSVSKAYGGQETVLARYLPGMFFGEVPLLLGVPNVVTARAESACRLIAFPATVFWKLLRLCPSIASAIFRAMSVRLRNLEGSAQQREKLAALGTMSAGLAHELNNPSAAARRAAVHLEDAVLGIQDVGQRLHHSLESEQWRELIAFVERGLERAAARAARAPWSRAIARSGWPRPCARRAWPRRGRSRRRSRRRCRMSPALKRLAEKLPPAALPDALRWIAARLSIRALLEEAEQSTARIADLVECRALLLAPGARGRRPRSMSRSSSRPRSPRSRRSCAASTVVRDFAPGGSRLRAYASELQQVWVNLLENAADALAGQGRITAPHLARGRSIARGNRR